MIFDKYDRIVFAGDSVTEMRSQNPVGEGLFDALGFGYVRMVENLLMSVYPEYNIRVTNSGVGGNTSLDLLNRWERDVLNLNPDWVSIMVGINDVWRQFDTPAIPERAVSPVQYEQNVENMIQSLKGRVKGIFLMTPYYMEPNPADTMRARMDEYGAVCKRLAEKHGCMFIDTQAMFDRYFAHQHSTFIAWDRVHPNQIGAMLIAREFLKQCGFDYNHEA
jgi:lysophospholipase L1-like esterase